MVAHALPPTLSTRHPMNTTLKHRALLATCAAVAATVGIAILVAPAAFHATNGIEFAATPSTLSEVRAPGGALVALAGLMLAGVFRPMFAATSTAVAAAVFLSYGVARLFAMAVDGIPADGLVAATLIELVLGGVCAVALLRRSSSVVTPAPEAA